MREVVTVRYLDLVFLAVYGNAGYNLRSIRYFATLSTSRYFDRLETFGKEKWSRGVFDDGSKNDQDEVLPLGSHLLMYKIFDEGNRL